MEFIPRVGQNNGSVHTTDAYRIRRTRERLACAECRRRKSKCDRQLPCAACVRSHGGDKCHYQRFSDGSRDKASQLEDRLKHLKQVVRNVAQPNEAFSTSKSSAGTSNDSGRHHEVASTEPKGATHWSSIWDDIQDLRLQIQDERSAACTEASGHESIGIIFGGGPSLTMKEVLASYLPPQLQVDRMVAAYYKTSTMAAGFVHAGQFQRLYREFWNDPMAVSPLWVSLLFTVCYIAKSALRVSSPGSPQEDRFATAAAHCLVIGEYHKPKPWAVESLLIFAQSHCLTCTVLSPDIATIFGILSRTATLSGYHRPPESLGLSPFEIESRSRVWSALKQLDLLVSFHTGIPSAMPGPTSLIAPPRNLYTSDYDEDTKKIPSSRPLEEPTEAQFLLAKHGFIVVFDKILNTTLCTQQQHELQFSDVFMLDQELRDVYKALPPSLKIKPMSEAVFDSPSTVVARLCVIFLYTKCLVVLHRPMVLQRKPGSIKACYDAAVLLLRTLCDTVYEFQPGGQVDSHPWFMKSLTWHDFLLGSVGLCLSTLIGREVQAEGVEVGVSIDVLLEAIGVCASGYRQDSATSKVQKIMEATVARLQQTSSIEGPQADEATQLPYTHTWNGEDALWDEMMDNYLDLDSIVNCN